MVDPLGPFVTLIRSLSRRKPEAAERTAGATPAEADKLARDAARTSIPARDLRTRLKSRLVEVGTVDPDRARRTFVETVLLHQLGDDVAGDPAFADLVGRVADQLHADRQLRSRLAELITAIAA